MKTAILGGSFDPIHLGHLFLLHSVASRTEYRNIYVIPAAQSNFKRENACTASDHDRLEMVHLAVRDYREIYPQDQVRITVSDMELKRGGISYTLDTVKAILDTEKQDRVGLIIGDDHICGLTRWYGFEELKTKVVFIVCRRIAGRADFENTQMPEGTQYIMLDVDQVSPESATAIRENREQSMAFLSPGVREYVRSENLYN